ncbi:MAG: hypothetical protein GY788_02705 [bacterium]|nr:hypothetical protein [bacterium]
MHLEVLDDLRNTRFAAWLLGLLLRKRCDGSTQFLEMEHVHLVEFCL